MVDQKTAFAEIRSLINQIKEAQKNKKDTMNTVIPDTKYMNDLKAELKQLTSNENMLYTDLPKIIEIVNKLSVVESTPNPELEKLEKRFSKCVHVKGYSLSKKYTDMLFDRYIILNSKSKLSREYFEEHFLPGYLKTIVKSFNDSIKAECYSNVLSMMAEDGLIDTEPLEDLVSRTRTYEDIEIVRAFATKYDLLDKVDMSALVKGVERMIEINNNPQLKKRPLGKLVGSRR